jgi:HK97 family phage major capsid protein
MKRNSIKTGVFYRLIDGDDVIRAIDEDKRTVALSFSSETPVERYFGREILGHKPDEVDLTFLQSGRAPLLREHWRDEQTGVVESASIKGKKGQAVVRFGKSQRAEDEFQDVKDNIRSNVSVGYRITKAVLIEKDEEKGNTYRVHWKPLEVSIVSIPADDSVGIGRAEDDREFETEIEIAEGIDADLEECRSQFGIQNNISKRGLKIMPKKNEVEETRETPVAPAAPPAPAVDVDRIKADTRQEEQNRCADIMAIGESHGFRDQAIKAIGDGKSVEQFRAFVLDEMAKRGARPVDQPDPAIGLSDGEAKRFSFVRLIRALATPNDRQAQEAAGFEMECSKAVAQRMHKEPKGAFIPMDVMLSGQRDLNTADDSALVGTVHMASAFIDILRNKLVLREAGARILDGLVGNLAIPKRTAGASVYWVAEGITNNPTESEASYGAVAMTPKTVGTYTEITRQMLAQSSPAIEQLTRDDLAAAVGLGIDLAGLHGTGIDNQPTGVAATSGIGAVPGGADGAAPTDSHIIDLETAVAIDNADLGALAYITNTKVRGKLKKTDIGTDTGIRVWDRVNTQYPLNGYRALVTNQVKSNLVKGASGPVCSAIFYGNWNDLIIGMWGALDILVDPYTYSKSGGLLVRALQDIDIAVRHAESFSAMLDALTT